MMGRAMTTIELLGTAVALAMDAFAVAIAAGISLRRAGARQTFRLAFHFGLFQALMPVAGWSLGNTLAALLSRVDHWIAFALLAFVGARMIWAGACGGAEGGRTPDPTRGGALVLLSLATSIDALAVGFSLSMLHVDILLPALVIGAVCAAFTAAGLHLCRLLDVREGVGRWSEVGGGIILLAIGGRILWEHGIRFG